MRMLIAILAAFAVSAPFFAGRTVAGADRMRPSATPKKSVRYDKLPPNVTLSKATISYRKDAKGEFLADGASTVEKELKKVRARYRKDLLIDSKGREIRFFQSFCRGVSAGQDEDAADRKTSEDELSALRKKFTVIVLACDPLSVM